MAEETRSRHTYYRRAVKRSASKERTKQRRVDLSAACRYCVLPRKSCPAQHQPQQDDVKLGMSRTLQACRNDNSVQKERADNRSESGTTSAARAAATTCDAKAQPRQHARQASAVYRRPCWRAHRAALQNRTASACGPAAGPSQYGRSLPSSTKPHTSLSVGGFLSFFARVKAERGGATHFLGA